jgi:hypothetical protein
MADISPSMTLRTVKDLYQGPAAAFMGEGGLQSQPRSGVKIPTFSGPRQITLQIALTRNP